MPRGPRPDAPDGLHHVMLRGLERRGSLRDDADREEFVRCLAVRVERGPHGLCLPFMGTWETL